MLQILVNLFSFVTGGEQLTYQEQELHRDQPQSHVTFFRYKNGGLESDKPIRKPFTTRNKHFEKTLCSRVSYKAKHRFETPPLKATSFNERKRSQSWHGERKELVRKNDAKALHKAYIRAALHGRQHEKRIWILIR